MIRFQYRNQAGSIIEFTDRVNLDKSSVVLTNNAEQGTVPSNILVVDDPLGDWDIGGHRLVFIHEDTADPLRMWVGYTFDRDIKRGGGWKTGAGRVWHVTVNDLNSVLHRRIMYGAENDRPAETDVERMQWLVTTNEFALVEDTTLLSTASPVNMDAVDYNGQYGSQIIDDCSQASGKNWYLYPIFNSPDWEFALWYGHEDLAVFDSPIRISNLLSDIDNVVTFEPSFDTNLNRSPSRVYSGAFTAFDGDAVYRQRDATATAFARRDTNLTFPNVKSEARAIARTDRILGTLKTEEDIITTTILLPPEQVNDVLAGQRIEAKWTHLPGYEDFSWMRVLRRTTTFLTPQWYQTDLTLSAKVTPGFEHFLVAFVVCDDAAPPQDLSDHPWTQAWWSGDFTTASVLACGAGPPQNQAMGMYYRAIESGETTTVATFKGDTGSVTGMWVYEVAGCDMTGLSVVDDGNEYLANSGTVDVSATATEDSVLIGGVGFGKVNYDSGWCTGWTGGTALVTNAAGTQLVNKSAQNDCAGFAPWAWVAYEEGTGTLTISATANSHGGGSGAYNCGYNVGKGGLLIPSPGGFSIIQSAFDGNQIGDPFDVDLPSPPTP